MPESGPPRHHTRNHLAKSSYAAGSLSTNVVPSPCAPSTQIVPWWYCTACLTMASPRPVPPVSFERLLSRRKNRSNTFSRISSGMPAPVSLTRTVTTDSGSGSAPAARSASKTSSDAAPCDTRTDTLPPAWL